MAPIETHQVTVLLQRVQRGDSEALAVVAHLMHAELRRIAGDYLRRQSPGHTWQPTDLVNELWVRLLGREELRFENRGHFLGVAAHLMRKMIIDHARARLASKRSPDAEAIAMAVGLTEAQLPVLVELDGALIRLAQWSPRQAQIVEMRHFGGMTIEETATAMSLSVNTVKRDWNAARAWLHRELRGSSL